MIRRGALIIFKPEIGKAEAERILEMLESVLDENYFIDGNRVREFHEEAGPVWYIP